LPPVCLSGQIDFGEVSPAGFLGILNDTSSKLAPNLRYLAFAAMTAMLPNSNAAQASESHTPLRSEKTASHDGFDRYDSVMDDASCPSTLQVPEAEKICRRRAGKGPATLRCRVPKRAAAKPMVLARLLLDHEPQTEVELLRRGFHIAFITPDPGKQWDAWYSYLTEKHGLSKKPAFVGMSKGGVNEYDWATANPTKSPAFYADNPAIRPGGLHEIRRAGQERRLAAEHLWQSRIFCSKRHTLPSKIVINS